MFGHFSEDFWVFFGNHFGHLWEMLGDFGEHFRKCLRNVGKIRENLGNLGIVLEKIGKCWEILGNFMKHQEKSKTNLREFYEFPRKFRKIPEKSRNFLENPKFLENYKKFRIVLRIPKKC